MAGQWERHNVSPTLPGGEPLPGVHSYLRCCSCKSPKGKPHKAGCEVTPDIDWSADFRLAVIEKIERRYYMSTKESDGGFAIIGIVARETSARLPLFADDIESALGCTLTEVREEMERNAG